MKGTRLAFWIALAIWFVGALAPLLLMIGDSFVVDGRLSLAAYGDVWLDSRRWSLFESSLLVGIATAIGAVLLGVPVALAITRFEFPGRTLVRTLYPLPLLLPPFVHAIAWTRHVPLSGPIGAVVIFSLAYFPFVTLLCERAIQSIGAPLLDAARLHSSDGRTIRRIVLPLAMPSILAGALLAFLFAISDFSVPDYLSTVGTKFNVFATEVFSRWTRGRSRPEAMAASLPLVLLSAAAIVAVWRLRTKGRVTTIGGEFAPLRREPPRGAQWGIVVAGAIVVAISALGPLIIYLVWAGGPASYRAAVNLARWDILTSLGIAAAAATAMALVALPLAHAAVRRGAWVSRSIEIAALAPLAFPGITLGIGLVHVWNRGGAFFDAIYDTVAIVVIALSARLFAFPFEAERSALERIDPEMEEAAAVAGVPRGRRFRRIVLSLARDGVLTGWILGFVFSLRELDTLCVLSQGYSTIPFRLYNLIHTGKQSYVAALAVILLFLVTLPLVLRALLTRPRSA
ncbi:MAG: iron ABC transporter permease [Planctomycetes bacterium]|nr:iron ABC transporter permease [Planctomycetota bacterium]MBI3847780.1 iron ABC transporter permease [Planctomycetota bacterium]